MIFGTKNTAPRGTLSAAEPNMPGPVWGGSILSCLAGFTEFHHVLCFPCSRSLGILQAMTSQSLCSLPSHFSLWQPLHREGIKETGRLKQIETTNLRLRHLKVPALRSSGYDFGQRDLLAEIEYKIILVMFFTSVFHLNCTNCCFLCYRMVPLYLNTLYDNWRFPQVLLLSCLEGKGKVRGIQLQHATSPLDVTKLYTLNL